MSDRDEICDQIDDLITSVDGMRWRPEPPGDGPTNGNGPANGDGATSDAWVPADCQARFDALHATIDAFAGAVDDRMEAWADRVEGSFAEAPAPDPAERDAFTASRPDRR